MTRKTYKTREREVGKIAEGVAKAACKVMLDKECELVKENGGVVDGGGLLTLSVSYDIRHGMVQTRSCTQFTDRSWCSNGFINWESTRFYYENQTLQNMPVCQANRRQP